MVQNESMSATQPEMYEVGYAPEKKEGEEEKDGGSDATSYYDSEYDSSTSEKDEGTKEESKQSTRMEACEKLKE